MYSTMIVHAGHYEINQIIGQHWTLLHVQYIYSTYISATECTCTESLLQGYQVNSQVVHKLERFCCITITL